MTNAETRKPWRGRIGWLEAGFLALLVVALGLRLWELGGRPMHYDEAIHLHYAWRLSNGDEYFHSPWMHGPFQIEMSALIFRVLGDTDFTARAGYALFGTGLAALPYLLRRSLGRTGALFTGLMLAVSPTLLYFSRFGRNDIIMAFWAALLLVLMWRHFEEDKDRYLYLASAVLAVMFATKETAFFVAAALGALAFLLAIPQWAPLLFRRAQLRDMAGPAGFCLLIATLTLPQWSALGALFQDLVGLDLINRGAESTGITGAPVWGGSMLHLPVVNGGPWAAVALVVALASALASIGIFRQQDPNQWDPNQRDPNQRGRNQWDRNALLGLAASPMALSAAAIFALFRPVGHALDPGSPSWAADLAVAGLLLTVAAELLHLSRPPLRPLALRVALVTLVAGVYAVLATPLVNVNAVVNALLPSGVSLESVANGIPWNYVGAILMVAVTLAVSVVAGIAWRGRTWLLCAAIFYLVWLALYTTVFTNPAGAFSGVWQGMGYWIAQQEVARGNQPWYYYFVGLSIYETLPLVFGALGAWYFLRKGDVFGMALVFWAGLSLLAYTLASEKMPWLLVNITLPFIFLAGKYLGELTEAVQWRAAVRRGVFLLPALAGAVLVGIVYLFRGYVSDDAPLTAAYWLALVSLMLMAVLAAVQVRRVSRSQGAALLGLGAAGVLLAFGTWSALQAAFTFDDSRVEILAYAQGSADHLAASSALSGNAQLPDAADNPSLVDYDVWYPLQWYVRHETEAGAVRFSCFKEEGEAGWREDCVQADGTAAPALLVSDSNDIEDGKLPEGYRKTGPQRDLLWFPESYRRPGEHRQEEGLWEELGLDLAFFAEAAFTREAWREALGYALFRDLKRDWYDSKYHTYSQ